MLTNFQAACPGETLSPTYTFTGIDLNIKKMTASLAVDWSLGTFSADAVYTVTIGGQIAAPHTMTIT